MKQAVNTIESFGSQLSYIKFKNIYSENNRELGIAYQLSDLRDSLWLGPLNIEGYLLPNSQTWGTHICGSIVFLFWRLFVFNIKTTHCWLDTAQATSSGSYNH